MKLLESFKMAFNELPTEPGIYKFLDKMRVKLGNREFLNTVWYWYGGRGYNEFVDYSLLALKIRFLAPRTQHMPNPTTGEDYITESVKELLFDDRHDFYQNIPYLLNPFLNVHPELEESFAMAWIECFNIKGTGDQAHVGQLLRPKD